jgi:hypothetical protein
MVLLEKSFFRVVKDATAPGKSIAQELSEVNA